MEFKNTDTFGWEAAFRGMRNPKNSWQKSDSGDCTYSNGIYCNSCNFYQNDSCENENGFVIGPNDMKLAQTLLKAGNEHAKFMRMIHVQVDVDMPRYWWSEADTYHFNTKNSCSTMHKLLNNVDPITKDMFVTCEEDDDITNLVINRLESLRIEYKYHQANTKDNKEMNRLLVRAKRLLMEGFLQMRTWDTSYAELRNMYFQRRYHGLKEEWVDTFCDWIKTLPYAEELIMYEGDN